LLQLLPSKQNFILSLNCFFSFCQTNEQEKEINSHLQIELYKGRDRWRGGKGQGTGRTDGGSDDG
jgi:hypothetical protein